MESKRSRGCNPPASLMAALFTAFCKARLRSTTAASSAEISSGSSRRSLTNGLIPPLCEQTQQAYNHVLQPKCIAWHVHPDVCTVLLTITTSITLLALTTKFVCHSRQVCHLSNCILDLLAASSQIAKCCSSILSHLAVWPGCQ